MALLKKVEFLYCMIQEFDGHKKIEQKCAINEITYSSILRPVAWRDKTQQHVKLHEKNKKNNEKFIYI